MTKEEAVHWLFAIETVANGAGEVGDFEAQEFCCDWYAAFRDGLLWQLSAFNGFQNK